MCKKDHIREIVKVDPMDEKIRAHQLKVVSVSIQKGKAVPIQ